MKKEQKKQMMMLMMKHDDVDDEMKNKKIAKMRPGCQAASATSQALW